MGDRAVFEVGLGHGSDIAGIGRFLGVENCFLNYFVSVLLSWYLKERITEIMIFDLILFPFEATQQVVVFTEVDYLRPHLLALEHVQEVLQSFLAELHVLVFAGLFNLQVGLSDTHRVEAKGQRLVLSLEFPQTLDDVVLEYIARIVVAAENDFSNAFEGFGLAQVVLEVESDVAVVDSVGEGWSVAEKVLVGAIGEEVYQHPETVLSANGVQSFSRALFLY